MSTKESEKTADINELSEDDQLFYQSVLERRRAYLLFLRLKGYEIGLEEISKLRQEIRTIKGLQSDNNVDLFEDLISELQGVLAFVDEADEPKKDNFKVTLYKIGSIKVRMRPERNHGRAHFHIEYKKELSASYAVDTFECLAGNMPRKYEEPILAWAEQNQANLLATWNQLNAGVDVRELIIARDGESPRP